MPQLDDDRRTRQQAVNTEGARHAELSARLEALKALQEKVKTDGKLAPWLAKHGLEGLQGLWSRIHIEQGWENALEAALRERLGALEVSRLDMVRAFGSDAPPAKLAFYSPPAAGAPQGAERAAAPVGPAAPERCGPAGPAGRLAARLLHGADARRGAGAARQAAARRGDLRQERPCGHRAQRELHIDPHPIPGRERHEPLFDPDLPAPTALAVPTPERRGGLDPLIDVIAPISLDGLASGDAAIAAMPATRRAGSKPVAIEGLNEHTGEWEPAAPGSATAPSRPACSWPTAPARSTRSSTPNSSSRRRPSPMPSTARPSFPRCWTRWPRARARPVRERRTTRS